MPRPPRRKRSATFLPFSRFHMRNEKDADVLLEALALDAEAQQYARELVADTAGRAARSRRGY